MKWIDCQIQLPENDANVLLYLPVYKEIVIGYVHEYMGDIKFYQEWGSDGEITINPSHWMSLPEVPK